MTIRRYDDHARGTLPLPHDCLLGNTGDIVPGYVCCRCGGVELSEHMVGLNHGCCDGMAEWRGGLCTARGGRFHHWNHLWTDDPIGQLDLLALLAVAA
jgi:hypothetical protein